MLRVYLFLTNVLRWIFTWRTLPVMPWVEGAVCFQSGHFESAARYFDSGINAYPDHPACTSALLDAAYSYLKVSELKKAEERARKAIDRDPNRMSGYILLGRILLRSGRSYEASINLKESFLIQEPDAERFGLYLHALLESGGTNQHMHDVMRFSNETIVDIDPTHLIESALAGFALNALNFEKAFSLLDELILFPDTCIEAFIIKAQGHLRLKEVEEALLTLRGALCRHDDYPRVHSLLAEVYLKAGELFNIEYAKQHALRGCQLTQWSSIRELHVLAEAYYHAGESAEALMIARAARSQQVRVHGSYGYAADLDKLIESLSMNERAIS